MSAESWVAVAGLGLTVLTQLSIGAYVSGKLTQKIKSHSSEIETIKDEQIRQWSDIGDHEKRIGHIEGKLGI